MKHAAPYYLLLHELIHVYDKINNYTSSDTFMNDIRNYLNYETNRVSAFTDDWPSSFFSNILVTEKYATYVNETKFDLISNFYLEPVYYNLKKTPCFSLLSMKHPGEDFAEFVTCYELNKLGTLEYSLLSNDIIIDKYLPSENPIIKNRVSRLISEKVIRQ